MERPSSEPLSPRHESCLWLVGAGGGIWGTAPGCWELLNNVEERWFGSRFKKESVLEDRKNGFRYYVYIHIFTYILVHIHVFLLEKSHWYLVQT